MEKTIKLYKGRRVLNVAKGTVSGWLAIGWKTERAKKRDDRKRKRGRK